MEYENDLILREVKKITLLISNLISSVHTANNFEIENTIKETDDFIRKHWNISLNEIATISEIDFIDKLKDVPEIYIEKLAELLSIIVQKLDNLDKETNLNKKEFAKKGILLIDNLNERSKVYSIKRMEIKKFLAKQV